MQSEQYSIVCIYAYGEDFTKSLSPHSASDNTLEANSCRGRLLHDQIHFVVVMIATYKRRA